MRLNALPAWIFRGLAVLACAGLLLACQGNNAHPPSTEASVAGGDSISLAPRIAPEFALQNVKGLEVKLSDSAGKVRLVDFWATWCAPCREEIPMLNELQQAFGERGFEVLAISEEDPALIREFVESHDVVYTNLIGDAETNASYGVLGLPTAYLVDAEGKIVESFLGPKPRRILEEMIVELLEG